MACPTKEEYKKALESRRYLDDAIRREYKRRDELINQLCGSQKLLDGYREASDYQNNIVMKYELYQEIKNGQEN